jgi:hypothetical protein
MTRSLRPTAKILCAILWILVLSSALAAQVSPSAKSSLSDKKVSQAITNWKSVNKGVVQIDSAVAGEMASSIVSQTDPKNQPTNQPIDFSKGGKTADNHVDLLVSSYISELRDRKYEQTGSPPGSKIELRASDIQAFSFATYLQGLRAQDVLRDPGFLSVTSFPPGAAIKIDNGARGVTDKDFVVSKGKHSVLVKSDKLACTDGVDVEDDPVIYKCPK